MIRHGRTDGEHMGLDRRAFSHAHTHMWTNTPVLRRREELPAVVPFSLALAGSCQNGCVELRCAQPLEAMRCVGDAAVTVVDAFISF